MSLTVEQMQEQVKEVGGKVATSLSEKEAITYYVFIEGYPDVFEFFVTEPIANVELKPGFMVEELERIIGIKKEISRLKKLLSDGFSSNEDYIKVTKLLEEL